MARKHASPRLKPLQFGKLILSPPTVIFLIGFILLIGVLLLNLTYAASMGSPFFYRP